MTNDSALALNTIVSKKQLSEQVFQMKLYCPLIAQERKAGQFLVLQLDNNYGERIPLTIADADPEAGTITIIFQSVGKTTMRLAKLKAGEVVANVLGPLGTPTHIEKVGAVVCVCGGIGAAPMHPIAQALKQAGNRLIVILGARNRDLIVMEPEMRALADELIIVTDDGSLGRKALVTAPLKECCEQNPKPNLVVAIGPPIMMKFCVETSRPYEVPIVVSLNTIMVDGTGMCGGCRVTVGGHTKFVCVDGPEFNGYLVDFDNMMKRLSAYRKQETCAADTCRVQQQATALEGARP